MFFYFLFVQSGSLPVAPSQAPSFHNLPSLRVLYGNSCGKLNQFLKNLYNSNTSSTLMVLRFNEGRSSLCSSPASPSPEFNRIRGGARLIGRLAMPARRFLRRSDALFVVRPLRSFLEYHRVISFTW